MDHWHYDPAADLDSTQVEQQWVLCEPGLLALSVRSLVAAVLRCWMRFYHRLTIVGRENLPVERSFVMISNHASHLDTLCLLSALPLRQLHDAYAAAARDYFSVNALRAFLAAIVVKALPFDRQFAPWQSLSICAHLLQRPRKILIFFPEGTRSGSPEPGEFKPGVALLAAGRDIPVVPCHLADTHAALPKGAWFPRPKAVRLIIGRPHVYVHLPATRDSAKQICRELREAVVSLGNAERHEQLLDQVVTREVQEKVRA
jgi:1-acyl-sn-glycerol-3-phosphate acyltransferase